MDGKANSVRFLVTVSEALFGPLPSREPEGLRRGFDALSGARPICGDGHVMGVLFGANMMGFWVAFAWKTTGLLGKCSTCVVFFHISES